MKIVVASQNPIKLESVRRGFLRMFPADTFEILGISVSSGVRSQPLTSEETYMGAYNRVCEASRLSPDADYWVGIEGGVEKHGSDMEAFAWVAVKSKTGAWGKARSAGFFLPPKITALIEDGKELGEADDIVFGRKNSKNGAVGLLTGDAIDRTSYYTEAVTLACIPFKNTELY